jgi:hypothetical protein
MNSKCTSVHIRRGDYISHPLFKNICTVGYYKSAIEYVRNNAVIDNLIIFSNDIKWCEETFCESITGLKNIYVSWNSGEKSFRDMQLMSLCQNNIVANSSFSWWGAWLNQHDNKIVVCPSIWMNKGYAPNIIPEDWITI